MRYLALLFAVLLSPSQCSAVEAADGPIRIQVDKSVWPQARDIDWPGPARTVGVVFNAHSGSRICGKPLSIAATEQLEVASVVFGVACGELFVLMKRLPVDLSRNELELVAAHEAIHAVTLSTTRKISLDTADSHRHASGADQSEVAEFFQGVTAAMRSKEGEVGPSCTDLHRSLDSLGPPELASVTEKINGEWSAEFFMRIYGAHDDDRYEELRAKISAGEPSDAHYVAGGIAMFRVDEVIGREAWQRRTSQGESLADLLFEALGCDMPNNSGKQLLVTVKGVLLSLVVD